MNNTKYSFKPIDESETLFLEDMLYYAIYAGEGTPPSKGIIYEPNLYKYIEKWNDDKDIGYIIIDDGTEQKLGAVWIREFDESNQGYGYIDDSTPELSIAIYPEYRGKGLGTALMNHLISQLPSNIKSISLSVDTNNPAKRLYERLGFEYYKINNGTAIMKYEKK